MEDMRIIITVTGDEAKVTAPKGCKAIDVLGVIDCISEDLTNKFNNHMEEIANKLNITEKSDFDKECDNVLYSEITKSKQNEKST